MIDTRVNAIKQLMLLMLGILLVIGLPGALITGDARYLYVPSLVFGLPLAQLQGVFDPRLWRSNHGSHQPKRVR